ncbi:MAG TPA: glycosyltransferase [Polyangia bacterium]|jgi:glycosyltransferase involved in cell wall biosynthesis|nr:glycosyltransferase [Polyangia bacterium]
MRALYLSHTGMTEPLGQSQVLPYVRGLVQAGWDIDIVGFEPADAPPEEIARTEAELRALGVGYFWTRRSPSHALAVKVRESAGALLRLARRAILPGRRPSIIHARSYLPGAVAQTLAAALPGARFLFDCRGLLGDEYLDAGIITRESFRYRLIKQAERRLFRGADGVVVLTERLRRWLREEAGLVRPATPVEVIPCCVDLGRFRIDAAARAAARESLGAGDRFVLVYSGSLGSWYYEEEMARLFAALRRRRRALFLVLTRSPSERLRAALASLGVPEADVVVRPAAPRDMPQLLAAGDGAVSFIAPCFSKIASSPTKIAEYLAVGLPVVMNEGVGDGDELIREVPAVIGAGALGPAEIEAAAERLLTLAAGERDALQESARRAAAARFSLAEVGVPRYRRIYRQLLGEQLSI